MKTAEIPQFGLEALAFVDRPEPKPSEHEVLVRMRAASLNFRDLMVVRGDYNPKMKLPAVPLSDGAGEVVEIGPGVTRVKTGDRVMGCFMPGWISGELTEAGMRSALGAGGPGVASDYVVFHEESVVQIPGHLSWEEAATLPCAGVTAWNAIVTEGDVRPDETVLVQGSGGVSVFALQFAKLMHARVMATSSRNDKLDRLRELGADHCVNYAENPDWEKAAREWTGGRGVDHIVEVGGSGTLGRSMRAAKPGGRIYVIGVLAGKNDISFVPVFMRALRLQGIFVGSREMFEEMNRAIAAHNLHPVVDRVFAFPEVADALRYMESGAHFGKICVRFE
jgi:NADPH:quinone reductase-like Zn-dependent oxidoreductase